MGALRQFKVWRGDKTGGQLEDFKVEVNEGEVVLDVIHRLQATQTPDLAVRWNCKAGKCGSCSMEINGKPRLACMTRMNSFGDDEKAWSNLYIVANRIIGALGEVGKDQVGKDAIAKNVQKILIVKLDTEAKERAAKAMARANGMTASQERRARQCLASRD